MMTVCQRDTRYQWCRRQIGCGRVGCLGASWCSMPMHRRGQSGCNEASWRHLAVELTPTVGSVGVNLCVCWRQLNSMHVGKAGHCIR